MTRQIAVPESDNGATLGVSYIRAMPKKRRAFWTTICDAETSTRLVPVIAESDVRETIIYGLVGSDRPKDVRYVGRTTHPHNRFEGHLQRGVGKIAEWVESIERDAKHIKMVQLELCHPSVSDIREDFWLRYYQAKGLADLNTAPVFSKRDRRPA